MHIHLDPVGGIAGDMFIAAVLDAWPELGDGLVAAVRAAGLPASAAVRIEAHRDHTLTGSRFAVDLGTPTTSSPDSSPHEHVHWRTLRHRLEGSDLDGAVCGRAIAIFSLLAAAEGAVHGQPAEEVGFHEVGAWDSIADIVGAAFLIESLGASGWSTAPLPIGSGRVGSAHGTLPVPAPATVRLLEDLPIYDDGIGGERVTPTGAAVLRYLQPTRGFPRTPHHLCGNGLGFGSRTLPTLSNVLRLFALEPVTGSVHARQEVAVLCFEIDDQPAEDLAVGLDRLRALPAVRDVVQGSVVGKKGRLTTQIQILAAPEAVDAVAEACFHETTTLGLRWHLAHRAVLPRGEALYSEDSDAEAPVITVKHTRRPGGVASAKGAIDDVAAAPGGAVERATRRQRAEAAVLAKAARPEREER